MSLKILKKIFVVYFLAGTCTSLNARATLRFLDEWAKSLDYSNEKAKYVDLTWGAVAIETGFIHNLRFFGDYQIEVEKGKRIYAKDKSEDPLFAIIRELFPSTGGVLSTTVNANSKLCNELSCIATALIIKNYFLEISAQPKANIKRNISSYITSKTLKKENSDLDTLLDNIEKIINAPDKHKKEVLAQILLAFLYEKINLQVTKINNDTNIYKEETVGKLKSAFGEGMFLATIPQIEEETEYNKASKAARSYFNDLWQDNPFPYIAAPIQNGLAQVIPMEGGPLSKTFPDCVEVAIRHFFNIILYDPKSEGFYDLKGKKFYNENFSICDAKQTLFNDFYAQQSTRDLANNGSIELRTEWNKIMTHIPEVIYKVKDDGTSITEKDFTPYQQGNKDLASNEIKAGVINLYNVLAYLFSKEPITTKERSQNCKDYEQKSTEVIKELKQKFLSLFQNKEIDEDDWDDSDEVPQYRFGLTELEISMTNVEVDQHDIYADVTIRGEKPVKIGTTQYIFSIHIIKGHANIILEFANKQPVTIDLPTIEGTESYKIETSLYLLANPTNRSYTTENTLLYWLYQDNINSLTSLLRFAYRLENQSKIQYDESFIENLCNDIDFLLSEERNSLILNDIDIKENNFLQMLCSNSWQIKKLQKKAIRNQIDAITLSSNATTINLNFSGQLKYLSAINIAVPKAENITITINAITQNSPNITLIDHNNLKTLSLETIVNVILKIENCPKLENIKFCFNVAANCMSFLNIRHPAKV